MTRMSTPREAYPNESAAWRKAHANVLCAKCGHLPYNHEDSEFRLVRCYYFGCKCRKYVKAKRKELPWR